MGGFHLFADVVDVMVELIIDLWNVLGSATQSVTTWDNKISGHVEANTGYKICWGTLGLVGIRLYGSSGKRQDFKGDLVDLAIASCGSRGFLRSWTVVGGGKQRLFTEYESFIVSYRNRTYRIIATEFAYWAPNIESIEVNFESNPLERKDVEGPSFWMESGNEEIWMSIVVIRLPKYDSLKKDEIVMIRSCIMMGYLRIDGKNLWKTDSL
ncbi:hypothetical protein Tco_1448692 [Tanacetum coccineum]